MLLALHVAGASLAAAQSHHANLEVHVLEPGLPPHVDPYSLGTGGSDWAGRWWVEDINDPFPIDPVRDPLLVVAFETLGPGPTRQSQVALLRSDPVQKRFFLAQMQSVGPSNSEIHFVQICAPFAPPAACSGIPGGPVHRLDVWEGLDPGAALARHQFSWNGVQFVLAGVVASPLPAPPEALPRPLPPEMVIGAGPGVPFDVTTNSSVVAASRVLIVESPEPSPDGLTVEADPKGGSYAATVPVVLFSSSPSATIRYTLDGSNPVATSPAFQPGRSIYILPCSPLTGVCSPQTVLSFQATETGKNPSPIVRETYSVAQGKAADTDRDGLLDFWEAGRCISDCREPGCCADPLPAGCTPHEHCFDPLASDADVDCDRDGWSDLDELRLASAGDEACGDDVPPAGSDLRQVQIAGRVRRPGLNVADSVVQSISPRGSDLNTRFECSGSGAMCHADVVPLDCPAGESCEPRPLTDASGDFSDARTRGESDVILATVDGSEPQVVLQRFVPRLAWAASLPATTFDDEDLAGLDADGWFALYTAALKYSVALGPAGIDVDARASAMLQVLEHTVETMLPQLALDYSGIPIGDVDRPPAGDFPGLGDIDVNMNGTLDRIELILGARGAGLTGLQARVLLHGTDLSLLGATLQEAAEDPANPTYAEWVAFAGDVFRAVAAVVTFHGTTDAVLTRLLDDPALMDSDYSDLAAYIDALPPAAAPAPISTAASREGRMEELPVRAVAGLRPAVLPPDVPGLVAAVKAAAVTTAAIYARVTARGETALYETGDGFAAGTVYRGIVADLVGARAANLSALGDIAAGAEVVARAVQEARLLAASGRTAAVQNLRLGVGVLAAALDAANGGAGALGNLNARMNGLVYRIDRAAGNPAVLAALEVLAPEFLQPDTTPPVVVAAPPGPLFTGSVSVSLVSDEPATVYYTLDGSDPVPGGAFTGSGINEVTGIVITTDTTLSWLGVDGPWGNTSGISRITYRQDTDADAVADINDNCPGAYNPGQEDFDGDLMGNACDPNDDNDPLNDPQDCRPLDPSLWSAPGEATPTITLVDKDTLEWTSLASVSGPATRYDLASGPLADLHGAQLPGDEFDGAVCLVNDTAALSFDDAQPPAVNQGFYYMARGDNVCGTGIYGRGSDGTERVTSACP